jgi:hypothetical protein
MSGGRIETFTRLMRPVFGYALALSWTAQMLAVACVILFRTEQAAGIVNAMGALGPIWAVGLSVLGIYVYRRSSEKMEKKNDGDTD